MTYTFKLARRLAAARPSATAVFACLALAGCDGSDQFASSDSVEQTLGDAAARPDHAGGGSKGSGDKGGKGRKTLTGVEISPSSVTLQPGGSRQFAASGVYSDGSTRDVSVDWSATGGVVTSGGLYTAGSANGTYHVVAASGELADTATVSVAGDPPPPPPPPSEDPPSGGLANECASAKPEWIWCDDFEQDRLSSYFEYAPANGSFMRAAGVGNEGSYGMRARFAQGQVNAGALHLAFGRTPQSYFRVVDGGTRDYREIYWRLYVRNQPGWVGGGGDKLSRVISFASESSWAEAMKAAVWSGGQADTRDLLIMDPVSGTDESGVLRSTKFNDGTNQRWLGAIRGTFPLFSSTHIGLWHCVEAHIRWNDAGAANGIAEFWTNGDLQGHRNNINWVGAFDAYGMNALFVENYWNAGSPQAQERYIDNLVVSTSRVGC